MSVTRTVLPHLSKYGTSTQCGRGEHVAAAGSEAGENNTTMGTTRMRNIGINKRLTTGLATGPALAAIRKPQESQTIGIVSGSSGLQGGTAEASPPPRDVPIPPTPFPGPFPERTSHYHYASESDGCGAEKPIYLPAIETNVDESAINRPLRLVDSTLLTSPTDAAYIRSRSVTPSPLGAPRDLLPRSKKPTLFAGYLPDLLQQDDDVPCVTDLLLTIEGHQDLKLPPRRAPTESRRAEKSRHKLPTHVLHMLDITADTIVTIEESLRKLLLCQSMGVRIEVSNRQQDFVPGKTVRPVFHCPRCMRHWTENGTMLEDCDEPEIPTAGPAFDITNRSHEIMQEFETLTPEDKRQVLQAVMISKASIPIGGCDDETDVFDSVMDVTLTGRRAANTIGSEEDVNVGEGSDAEDFTRLNASDRPTVDDTNGSQNPHGRNRHLIQHTMQHSTDDEKQAIATLFKSKQDRTMPHGVPKLQPIAHHQNGLTENTGRTGVMTATHHQRIEQHGGHHDGQGFESRHVRDDIDGTSHADSMYNMTKHKPVGKFRFPESQSQSSPEEMGQYGPDGAFYPGQYGSDGQFKATCRIEQHGERRGQRQPVIMGPDGKFYINASYGPDGRFYTGADTDQVGVTFLSAAEMAALKARQQTSRMTNRGVVGPDGFYYPNGSFQADGSFEPGGPPHSGHSIVWGPTGGGGPGLYYPPFEFGPAWPPGTPAPYHHDHPGQYGPIGGAGYNEDFYSDEESITTEGGEVMVTRQTVADVDEHYATNNTLCVTEDHPESPHPGHFTDDVILYPNEDLDGGGEDRDQPTPRDLFSPWDMEDDERLKDLSAAADAVNIEASIEQSSAERMAETDKPGLNGIRTNLTMVTNSVRNEQSSRNGTHSDLKFDDHELETAEDLENDVALKNLDSRILFVDSDDDIPSDDGGNQDRRETGSCSTQVNEANLPSGNKKALSSSLQVDQELRQVMSSSTKTDEWTRVDDTNIVRPSKSKGPPPAYMGVVGGESDSKHNASPSQHSTAVRARRGSVAAEGRTGSGMRRGSMTLPKPAKNLAVRNVTGKPDTKPGIFQKHMLATPLADLAQTNSMGINRGSHDVISGNKGSTSKPQDEISIPKPKLPSIGGGEPNKDTQSSTKSIPDSAKIKNKSINNIMGSGEENLLSEADGIMSSDDTVKTTKPRSARRGGKAIMKKTAKDTRKSVGRPQQNDVVKESDSEHQEAARKESISPTAPTDIPLGNCNDDKDIEKTNYIDRLNASSPTKSSSLLDKFSEFRISLPATSPLPTEHAPSFRMTYSTLPSSFGSSGSHSTMPDSFENMREAKSARLKKVKSFDFEEGYDIRARKSSSTRTLRKSSSKIPTKSRLRGSYSTGTTSSSARASQSSSAESVWESISEIWKRHKKEVSNMRKHVAESYLPLTNAFTFSMYTLAPGYAAKNRMLRERAAGIKHLKKPPRLNKPRAAARKPIGGKYVGPVK